MTVIIHLLFAKAVEYISGTKEEPPDLEVLSSNYFVRTGIGVALTKELNTFQRSVLVKMIMKLGVMSKGLKGRNYDAEPQLKLHDDIAHSLDLQGKHSMILLFNGSNLVLFVAGQTDLRTNLFQLGEDDTILGGSKDIEHGVGDIKEEVIDHGSKDALEELFGTKTRFWKRKFHKEFRVSLHLVKTQEDHSNIWRMYQVHIGHGTRLRRLVHGHMIHSHSFSLISVLSHVVFRVRFLMRLVAHMFPLPLPSPIHQRPTIKTF